jgi:gluconate kinase
MPLIILFGLPGTGKTYVGEVFKKYFGFYFYDGDANLTVEMKRAVKTKTVFSERMRDVFFKNLTKSIGELKSKHKRLVVSQTFIKERYRRAFLKKFKDANFILIKTNHSLREKRLTKRKDYPLDMEYARKMVTNFDRPKIDCLIIFNNSEGVGNLKKQTDNILRHLSL